MKFPSFALLLASAVLPVGALAAPAAPSPTAQIVRCEATRSLCDGLLVRFAASREPAVAARALLALGRLGKPQTLPIVLRQARASDPTVRAMAVYAIGLIGRDATGAAVGALADPSSGVRATALDALGRLATAGAILAPEDAVARIATLLAKDPDPLVRLRAALALAGFNKVPAAANDATGLLTTAFAGETDGDVRTAIAWSLWRAYLPQTPATFWAPLLTDRNDDVRIQALHALARSHQRGTPPDAAVVARITPLTTDRSWRVAEEARETLTFLNNGDRSAHLTAIPSGVTTPQPAPSSTAPALARPVAAPAKLAAPNPLAVAVPPLRAADAIDVTGPLPGAHLRVRLVTSQGPVVLQLYPEWAPQTVANFLALADRGFFDGIRWSRIVPDFVTQSGNPNPDEDDPPPFRLPSERNPLIQRTGIISMGLNYPKGVPDRDSASTEFYLTLSPQYHLDADFTVFGSVQSGFDVLGRLIESDTILRAERISDG